MGPHFISYPQPSQQCLFRAGLETSRAVLLAQRGKITKQVQDPDPLTPTKSASCECLRPISTGWEILVPRSGPAPPSPRLSPALLCRSSPKQALPVPSVLGSSVCVWPPSWPSRAHSLVQSGHLSTFSLLGWPSRHPLLLVTPPLRGNPVKTRPQRPSVRTPNHL